MKQTLVKFAVAIGAVALSLPAASPATASVQSIVVTPNVAQPGDTVDVSAVVGATGWTSGDVLVILSVSGTPNATVSLPSTPSWAAGQCTTADTGIICPWTPLSESGAAQLEAKVTVAGNSPAGTISVTVQTVIPGVQPDASESAPLLVTLTPTPTAPGTPTPTAPGTPTPTSGTGGTGAGAGGSGGTGAGAGETGGEVAVPTAVPAGRSASPSGTAVPITVAILATATAGGFALTRRVGRQH